MSAYMDRLFCVSEKNFGAEREPAAVGAFEQVGVVFLADVAFQRSLGIESGPQFPEEAAVAYCRVAADPGRGDVFECQVGLGLLDALLHML